MRMPSLNVYLTLVCLKRHPHIMKYVIFITKCRSVLDNLVHIKGHSALYNKRLIFLVRCKTNDTKKSFI